MKSNRPLWCNMSWRTHKCLRTCWGNMHFCRRSQLTYCISHCTKHRAKVHFTYKAPIDKLLRNITINMNLTAIVSLVPLTHLIYPPHTHCNCQTAPGTPPVIQLLWPFLVPAFIWWTTGGKHNLPLQPFSPQMPADIIKKGSVSGPCPYCHPPATLWLSSAATLQNSFHKWFISFQADFCITFTLVRQIDGPERYTGMTREEQAYTD